MRKQLTDALYVTDDDSEIMDVIADSGEMIRDNIMNALKNLPPGMDFSNTFVVPYADGSDGNYYALMYFGTPGDSGFIMYGLESFKANWSEVELLKRILTVRGFGQAFIKPLIEQVEDFEMQYGPLSLTGLEEDLLMTMFPGGPEEYKRISQLLDNKDDFPIFNEMLDKIKNKKP